MASVVGLTVIKKFTYRGDATEEWSNQYWFTGSVPADTAAWDALFAALTAQEKLCYSAATSIIAGYGYDSDADNAHAVYVKDIASAPIAGTFATAGVHAMPGDAAAMVFWKTSRNNTRGKPIYLRKYFHDVYPTNVSPDDHLDSTQSSTMNALAAKLSDGTFIDGRLLRSRKHSETIVAHGVDPWITTRTLKRRGKRPS